MEDKKPNEFNLTVKIINISLLDFDICSELPTEYRESGLNKELIQFEFNIGMKVEMGKKKLHIDLTTNFFADVEKKYQIKRMVSSIDFDVKNLDEILTDFKGKIPTAAMANLIGILLSTSRGFLVLKSVGTFMEGIYMPIVNPMVFFPKNANTLDPKEQ